MCTAELLYKKMFGKSRTAVTHCLHNLLASCAVKVAGKYTGVRPITAIIQGPVHRTVFLGVWDELVWDELGRTRARDQMLP